MQVWNVLHAVRWNTGRKKSPKIAICAPSHNFVTYRQSEKCSNISSRCPHNMVYFGSLAAEIDPIVWGTPANSNGFRVSSCRRQPNCGVEQKAPPIFGRATITLGIGPHSNYYYYLFIYLFIYASQPHNTHNTNTLQIGLLWEIKQEKQRNNR